MVHINSQECATNIQALNDTLFVIGGKWKIPVLVSILSGKDRFREIERSVSKISTKVLSSNLKDLEENLLIKRTVYDDIPVRVIYSPTEYAKTLKPLLLEMIKWGISHRDKIKNSR